MSVWFTHTCQRMEWIAMDTCDGLRQNLNSYCITDGSMALFRIV